MKRFNKRVVYYHLFNCILVVPFVFLFFWALSQDTEAEQSIRNIMLVLSIVLPLGIIALTMGYSLLYYKLSGYELRETQLFSRRGVVFNKKSIVAYDKIHAINKKQNLFQRIFGIAALLVDSGSSNTAMFPEIVIYEKTETVDALMKKLKALQNSEVQPDEVEQVEEDSSEKEFFYKFDAGTKFSLALLNTLTAFIVAVIIYIIYIGIIGLVFSFNDTIMVDEEEITMIQAVLFGGILALGIVVFMFITFVCNVFIRFYDFVVYKEKDVFSINHGLFVKNHNSFSVHKVKAIRLEQGILKRLFGFVTLRIDVVGYGEATQQNQQGVGMLIPLYQKEKVEKKVAEMFPDYVRTPYQDKTKVFSPFVKLRIIGSSLFFGLIFVGLALFFIIMKQYTNLAITASVIAGAYLLIIIFIFIDAAFACRNQALSITDEKITISKGSFIKSEIVILRENIVAIQDITTHYRKKKGLYSYRIHFYSNILLNTITVHLLTDELSEALVNSLIY